MRWGFTILLLLISMLFLVKGIELWSALGSVDGDGIGIKFIGVNINDHVLKENIPGYALGFSIASLIPILVAVNFALKKRIK